MLPGFSAFSSGSGDIRGLPPGSMVPPRDARDRDGQKYQDNPDGFEAFANPFGFMFDPVKPASLVVTHRAET